MDNAAKDLVRKILSELGDIKRLLVNAIASPPKERNSPDEQQAKPNYNKPTPADRQPSPSSTNPPVSGDKLSSATNKERFRKLTEWKPVIEIIGIGALVVYTGVTVLVWCESRKANNIARDALVAGQRPWVGLDDEHPLQTTPLMIDAKGTASLSYTISAKNFGNYGAQAVFPSADLVITQDLADMPEREKQFCRLPYSPRIGFVLHPGQKTRVMTWFPASVGNSGMVRHEGSGSEFQAWIIGCVSYADQYGTPHHTVIEFQLGNLATRKAITFEPSPGTVVQGDWVEKHSYFLD